MAKIKVRIKEDSPYSEYGYYRRGDVGYIDGYTNGCAVVVKADGSFVKARLNWIEVIQEEKPQPKFNIGDCVFEEKEDTIRQGEQKPADKVEPRFKVGDKIRRKTPSSCDKDMQVARIEKDYYVCNHIGKFSSEVVPFLKESSYDLIEQKPAWSEEDESMLYGVIETEQYMLDVVNGIKKFDVGNGDIRKACAEELNWLESLKDRYTWKPSDDQIWCLSDAVKHYNSLGFPASKLKELLDDLKKLKG